MEDASELERRKEQQAALLEEAARIVKSAEGESRTPDLAEDAVVLQLMARVRKLEEEIEHLKKHQHHTPDR